MSCDYEKIRKQSKKDWGDKGPDTINGLVSQLHAVRTHFIFELLQNAEDALIKRSFKGSRRVEFHLTKSELRFHHFGKLFDESDVKGICSIGESTKASELNTIGRFGIGFKSVYRYTNRPEIYSGEERFTIKKGVFPHAIPSIRTEPNETIIRIPLKGTPKEIAIAFEVIADALRKLNPTTLLFLRKVKEIRWVIESEQEGFYMRQGGDTQKWVRQIKIIGRGGDVDTDEKWLMFSQPVKDKSGKARGQVEIAFSMKRNKKKSKYHIEPLQDSPLVVFFPTVRRTHLGFLIQGPYKTNPSRETIPHDDEWNQRLARQTGVLLVRSLEWLRDEGRLDVNVLETLPMNPANFEGELMEPLFDVVKKAMGKRPLLPGIDGRFISAKNAMLGRTQDLRELLSKEQLSKIYGDKGKVAWLSGDITRDRSPELRKYLMEELDVQEIDVDKIVPRLNEKFLSKQPDAWIRNLYEFFNDRPRIISSLKDAPLIRLEKREHVKVSKDIFLPGDGPSEFSTVKRAVCNSKKSVKFLQSLGLEKADVVDNVIQNVLPKYKERNGSSAKEYRNDVASILHAYKTDGQSRKQYLISNLEECAFIPAVDAGNESECWCRPDEVYLPTERMKFLFDGIEGVLFVDSQYDCLKGEKIRQLLKNCGARCHLRVEKEVTNYPESMLRYGAESEVRKLAEQTGGTAFVGGHSHRITDYDIKGLEELLEHLRELDTEQRRKRVEYLWKELIQLERQTTESIFDKVFSWQYRKRWERVFNSKFVENLRKKPWIVDENGELQLSACVSFDTLGWEKNPLLQAKIPFKPPIIEEMLEKAGVDETTRQCMKMLMNSSDEEKRELKKFMEERKRKRPDQDEKNSVSDSDEEGDDSSEQEESRDGNPTVISRNKSSPGEWASDVRAEDASDLEATGSRSRQSSQQGRTADSESTGHRSLTSYVGRVRVYPQGGESSGANGADWEELMKVEAQAIKFICEEKPEWQRTRRGNKGFDLFQEDEQGNIIQWCEVKSMKGYWEQGKPIAMTKSQFNWAQEKKENYWLYVVERAGNEDAKIFPIQNPAERVQSFAFDYSWVNISRDDTDEAED